MYGGSDEDLPGPTIDGGESGDGQHRQRTRESLLVQDHKELGRETLRALPHKDFAILTGTEKGDEPNDDDHNVEQASVFAVQAVLDQAGALEVLKNRRPDLPWVPFCVDPARRSFSYVVHFRDAAEGDNPPQESGRLQYFSRVELTDWFERLHPFKNAAMAASLNHGGWTDAHYRGQLLPRKTAWAVFDQRCRCDYGYSDTWQQRIECQTMHQVLRDITVRVESVCGLEPGTLNSVNLNFYPFGAGIGFHADDEFLFNGLNKDCLIVSLSLGSEGNTATSSIISSNATDSGRTCQHRSSANDNHDDNSQNKAYGAAQRLFQVRLKKAFQSQQSDAAVREVLLEIGDLMTMEGLFQAYYLHSVWPGDNVPQDPVKAAELLRGERINLTWRTITRHLDGSDECLGLVCPLSDKVTTIG